MSGSYLLNLMASSSMNNRLVAANVIDVKVVNIFHDLVIYLVIYFDFDFVLSYLSLPFMFLHYIKVLVLKVLLLEVLMLVVFMVMVFKVFVKVVGSSCRREPRWQQTRHGAASIGTQP